MAINDSQPTVLMEPGNPGNCDRYLAFRATANRMGTLNIGYSMVGSQPTVWMELGNPGHRFAIQHFEVRTTANPMGYYKLQHSAISGPYSCSLSQISELMAIPGSHPTVGSSLVIQVIQIMIQCFDLRQTDRMGVT